MSVYDHASAEIYLQNFSNNPSRQMATGLVLEFASKNNDSGALIDFGCGTGGDSRVITKSDLDYFGVDLSPEMITKGRGIGVTNTLVGDLGALPFKDAAFSAGVSLWALQYKANLQSTVQEWSRVLKDDAPLLLIVPHPLYKFVRYSRDYFVQGEQWEQGLGIRRFNYYHTFANYINALINSGFIIEQIQEPQRAEDSNEYFGIESNNIPHDLVIEARRTS